MMMMMGYEYGGIGGWGAMALGMIIHLGFIALVVYATVRLFQAAFPNGGKAICDTAALDTLKVRYAKGEISSDQYQSMKKDIE